MLMKKIVKLALIAMLSIVPVMVSARDRIVTYEQLPQAAKAFITAHFADSKVSYAKLDDGKYEVKMADGVELEFSRDGEWDNVDCKYKAVPGSVLNLLPEGINNYVNASFPDSSIVKVDKERGRIEVELDNDLELVFDKNGAFLRIDD